MLSDHNCETRHIKSITGHKSDQAVESYNDWPSMEQQQKMSLVLSDFIGNASSGSPTSVQGKENEIQQQYRPIPDEFPHQEQLLSKIIFPPVQPPFHGMAIREAFPSIFTTVV